jgi:hypothetical protein
MARTSRLAVLEQSVFEPAEAAPHQDDDEIVVDIGAALRGPAIGVLFEQLHERRRDLRRDLASCEGCLTGFQRHRPTVPPVSAKKRSNEQTPEGYKQCANGPLWRPPDRGP